MAADGETTIGIMNIYTSLRDGGAGRRAHKPCSTSHVFIFPKVSYGFSVAVYGEEKKTVMDVELKHALGGGHEFIYGAAKNYARQPAIWATTKRRQLLPRN